MLLRRASEKHELLQKARTVWDPERRRGMSDGIRLSRRTGVRGGTMTEGVGREYSDRAPGKSTESRRNEHHVVAGDGEKAYKCWCRAS